MACFSAYCKSLSHQQVYNGLKMAYSFNRHEKLYMDVVFHAKKGRASNANAHLAHLQAPTHRLMLQLVKEPNFIKRAR
jgi:hypothetical protein